VLALVAIAFAIPAVGAGLALAATTNRLQSSDDELARGQLDAAAADARSAAAIVPWSSTPWLKLATIELAAGNARAARAVVGRAIDLAPDDFRLWLLAAQIESSLGNNEVVGAYMKRALELAPLVLPRLLIEPNLGLGNLP
jgi:tetratricopeptide (TPR) repeat protein